MRTTLGGLNPLPVRADFSFVIPLAAGQRLFFRVNDLASNSFDGTLVQIDITDVVEIPDAGVPDAALPDAAPPDAGVQDAGAVDAGLPDASLPDATPGVPDAAPSAADAATSSDGGSGCGCRTSDSKRGTPADLLFVLAAVALLRRRR
jgi:MYXO-CTERM domain-containing protein